MSQPVTSTNICASGPQTDADAEIPDADLPPLETQRKAHERLFRWARRLAPSEVMPLRADLRLACANAREGHAAFAPYMAKAREVGGVDLELVENLGSLSAALLFAQRQLDLAEPSPKTLVPRLSRGRRLRYTMLHQARAAASVGLIPEGPVERIAKGTGPIDVAEDLVALSALFRQHRDALCNRTVVDDAMLEEAERLGNELQNELKPKGLPDRKPATADEKQTARDDRDRFWTLLVLAHRETKRVADFLGVGNTIPSLQSRKPLRKKSAEASLEQPPDRKSVV